MRWEATDQFGNLYVAACDATNLEQLKPFIESMVEELLARPPRPIRLTIDTEYGEINGPDPEQVSHVLQVPWICEVEDRDGLHKEVSALAPEEIEVNLSPNP